MTSFYLMKFLNRCFLPFTQKFRDTLKFDNKILRNNIYGIINISAVIRLVSSFINSIYFKNTPFYIFVKTALSKIWVYNKTITNAGLVSADQLFSLSNMRTFIQFPLVI